MTMVDKKKLSKHAKLFFKIVFSGAAIYYVTRNIELEQVWLSIKGAKLQYLLLALALYVISQAFGALRLNSLFKVLPLKISQWSNIKLYWLGMFYNFFLPGGVGGDGYKVFILRKHYRTPVKKLLMAILAERFSGLSIILIYILGLVYYIDYELPYQGWFFLLIPVVSFGYYLFLYVFNKDLTRAFWKVTAWSLVIQGIQMVAITCILKAMGASLQGEWHNYLFLFFVASIAGAIPITLGGIGAREMTYALGAEYLGVSQGHAVALSLVFYFLTLLSAIPGLYFSVKTNEVLKGEVDLEEASEEVKNQVENHIP
jgi:uncharacterized membrane protein YbhN (UPF0104 family)